MKHWVEELAERLLEWWGDEIKEPIILNGGLSVSGLQHVGRLRGEITLNSALKRVLEEKGYKAVQYLTLYTQDEWKGKPPQLAMFRNPEEGRKYVGWRLIDVPDPKGCHDNWVEHFWEDFGGYLDKFAEDVKIITTTEMYKSVLKNFVKIAIEKKEEVREIINRYRKRKPFPEGWIPYNVVCESCKKIGSSKIVSVDLDKFEAEYVCENCGYRGKVSLENGKLNWRIEWAAIWSGLNVHFEPYGKDHATPGGSRDSAAELSIKIFNRKPPFGAPYEWVGEIYPDGSRKIMGSSDFSGFTPRQWYEVAEPEVIRYFYLINEPMKQLYLGLHLVPQYYDQYDEAEEKYYNEEESEENYHIRKSYELASVGKLPEKKPIRVPYSHLVLTVQAVKGKNLVEEVVERLRNTLLADINLSDLDIELLKRRIIRAKKWVELYAPENMKFTVIPDEGLDKVMDEILSLLRGSEEKYRELVEGLDRITLWTDEAIKNTMKEITSSLESKKKVKKFFGALYMILLGKKYGPRIAPMMASMDKNFVINRMKKVEEKL
ncbi:MAG: lysine--tRNA ligase [Candidatus Njordarchaeia archaeon]